MQAISFWQLSRILSKTGCASATELLITSSTSADAVCCASDSRVSFISRAFFIAICAWAANDCTSAICAAVNGRTVDRIRVKTPITAPFSSTSGTPRWVRIPPSSTLATMNGTRLR